MVFLFYIMASSSIHGACLLLFRSCLISDHIHIDTDCYQYSYLSYIMIELTGGLKIVPLDKKSSKQWKRSYQRSNNDR